MSPLTHVGLQTFKRPILRTIIFFALGALTLLCSAEQSFGQSEAITYTYDKLNRLTGVIYSSGPAIVYTYDAAGNRTAVQVVGANSPAITSLDPSSAVAGGQGFALTVNGAHFANNSVVQWGGSNRQTTYVNGSLLTAIITASDIASSNPVNVTVLNPSTGNISNAVSFSITSSLQITSVSPAAGHTSGGQQIKLTGSFVNLSSVMLGGVSAAWSYTNGAGDTSMITVTTPPSNDPLIVTIYLTSSSGGIYGKPNAFVYLPTVFTDNSLQVGVTTVKVQHIYELRAAVNALRLVAGLGAASWTDLTLTPGNTLIKAVHITELRANLEAAAAVLGYAGGSYTDPVLSSGMPIKRIHIEELRQRIRAIAG